MDKTFIIQINGLQQTLKMNRRTEPFYFIGIFSMQTLLGLAKETHTHFSGALAKFLHPNQMKNIFLQNRLFLVFLAFFVYPLFSYKNLANEWLRMEVDSVISVQFPEQPTPPTINGMQVYTLHTPEAVFLAMTFDQALKPGQNPVTDVQEFYLGFINSMVRNAKATLTDSASFNLKGYQGMSFSYTTVKEDGSKLTRFNKAILIKNKLYSLLYTPLIPPTESSQAVRKHFLESLEVKE